MQTALLNFKIYDFFTIKVGVPKKGNHLENDLKARVKSIYHQLTEKKLYIGL